MNLFARSQESGVRSQNALVWLSGYCALPLACIILALVFLSGCSSVQRDPPVQVWDDMKQQNKFKAQQENDVFGDHRDSRRPPDGTIARGHLAEDTPFFTGMAGDLYAGKNPLLDQPNLDMAALLKHGQSRYNTYCSPCHDREAMGVGIVPVHVPTWQPANLTEQRIVEYADGEIFNVVTNGRRSMPAYKYQVSVEDRWAIIAWVRVLQRAAHATVNDVPAERRQDLQ